MPTSIGIVFDNPTAVFFSGQIITGRVQVVCDKPKSCRGIEVEFKGYGRVHWTERRTTGTGSDRKTETRHFTSREKYYEMNYWVWGNGSDSCELPPGTHVFQFSFLLPPGIPSSFESHVGKVRHQCKAKMDIPWGIDKSCLRPYSVNTLYDLNNDPQAVMRLECTEHKYACCLWCRSGPMSLVLRIDRAGYVPGERMLINAECTNMTNNKINHTKAAIHQIITYYAEGSSKREHRKIAELKRPEIKKGDDDIWSAVEMPIPALPPSHLEYCRIIDIDYVFKFEMDPSGCHTDLEYEAPIVIGSIPLKQYFSSFLPGPPGMPQTLPPPPMPTYPGQPPAPGFVPPVQPPIAGYPSAPGQPLAPGFGPMPNQPPYNPDYPGGADPKAQYNPAIPPPAYPGPPNPTAPSAPVFPGAAQYPDMPLPSYNPCMFGVTSFTEDDSDDESRGQNGMNFAPYYVSYNLVDSKHQHTALVMDGSMAAGGYMVTGGSDTSSSVGEHTGDKAQLLQ